MSAIFYFNRNNLESQKAYKYLMNSNLTFTPQEIRGKNVANRLKGGIIDKIPTLYFPNKGKIEGEANIFKFLIQQNLLKSAEEPQRQIPLMSQERPPLPSHLQKVLKDPEEEDDDSYDEDLSSEESMDSLERSLENYEEDEESIVI
jgi:hypothetical protein